MSDQQISDHGTRPIAVLHLEDSDLDAQFVLDRLGLSGVTVAIDRAVDRASFDDFLSERRYDLILSDYQVPGFEGLQALEIARTRQPHAPFIFVSGAMGEELAVDALKRGATDYVLKDRLARLPVAVDRALQEARERLARQRAEERAAGILESINEGFVTLDADWRITYMNAAAERLNGQTREALLGQNHWEEFPAAVGTLFESELRRVFADQVTVEFENYYSPWQRWFSIKAYPSRDGGVCVQYRDITDEKDAARELSRREDELRIITDAIPALISYVDANGFYRFVNQQYEAWFGKSRDGIIDRHLSEVLGEDAYQVLRPSIERVLKGESVQFETMIPYENGGERHIHATYVPRLEAGGIVGYFSLVTDVTDRKRDERNYREGQERLRLALKGGRMGTWDINLQSGHLTSSDTCKSNYGRSPEDPFTYEDLAASVHEDDRSRWIGVVDQAVERVEDFTVEYRAVTPSREVRWVHVRGSCVTDPVGKVIGLTGVSIDISDRKRSEAEIADRELRYRLVANAANDAIWDWNLTTNQVVWNEGVRTNFGFTAEAVREDASWWVEHIHPADVDEVTRTIHEHIDHGPDEWEGEYRFSRADGSYAIVSDRGVIVRDDAGKPVRMVGSMLDLTEKKSSEEALRVAEERFAFVRESSGVGFWYCDLPFDVLEWDERVKSHFHLQPDAVVTISEFYNLIHPEDREPTRYAIERSIAERAPYDVYYRTVNSASGEETWVRAIGRTFYADDGTPTRFDGLTLDVTFQKRNEEELRRILDDEKRHAALLERVASASCSVNAVLSAESIARILTEEARSILNAKLGATSFTTADDCTQQVVVRDRAGPGNDEDVPDIDDALARRVCDDNLPVRLPAPPWCRLAAPLIAHGGKNIGVVQLAASEYGVFTAEDESVLVQLAAIASAGIENARLYEQLREQDRRKDEFLATLAHELRNPLAPVRTGLQILKAVPNQKEATETRAMMERQVGNMVRLIDDLLDVSRITRGKIDLQRARLDVSEIIAAAVEVSRPLIETGQHSLFIADQREPLQVEADLTRMAQVISNLLNNAAKYTPHGGRIELSARREGAYVAICVRDNGVGIAANMLPKVFDLFTQVGRTLEWSQGGLGIGLALVSRLVEMHGGTVSAHSEGAGKGSEFVVRLPIAKETATGSAATPGKSDLPVTSEGRRILVVDDNIDGAKSLARLLSISGHTAETVFNGTDAVATAQVLRPDVVFLDIGLPGMNGYEVAQKLRSIAAMDGCYLVALTGWGTADDQRRARDAGFDHHLTKPVDASEVVKLLQALPLPRCKAT